MPPDLNSLPPSSPSPSSSPHPTTTTTTTTRSMSHSPSHTPPHSLAAAATMNAGIHTEDLLRAQSSGATTLRRDAERQRRRSSIRMNLSLNDPGVPAPGEMMRSSEGRITGGRDRDRERTLSLGELHQELECEQEGQVNRLLTLIRTQQSQLHSLQTTLASSSSAVDDSHTPTSERPPPSRQSSFADLDLPARRPSSSFATTPDGEHVPGANVTLTPRDESAYYQAETVNLTRENQMLKVRVRELERQLAESQGAGVSGGSHSPGRASNLHGSLVVVGGEAGAETTSA